MSNSSILTVKEMIEKAFGNEESNRVDFRLIQRTLFLLAKQLRVLERKVAVDIAPETIVRSGSNITITELSLQPHTLNMKINSHEKQRNAKLSFDKTSSEKRKDTEKPSKKRDFSAYFKDDEKPKLTKKAEFSDQTSTKDTNSEYHVKLAEDPAFRKSLSDTRTDASSADTDTLKKKLSSNEIEMDEKKRYTEILERIEEQRELVLRVIHQRHDSREEGMSSPTPMASLERTDIGFEKLLIVERASEDDVSSSKKRKGSRVLSFVTPIEFKELVESVKELQKKLEYVDSSDLPDNINLMRELKTKGASLTDAMLAMQLSARVEATEKAVQKMTDMITILAKKDTDLKEQRDPDDNFSKKISQFVSKDNYKEAYNYTNDTTNDFVSHAQLSLLLDELNTGINNRINAEINDLTEVANHALKHGQTLERKLKETDEMSIRMKKLENVIGQYLHRLQSLDAGFATQMAIYQEQLTQMQMDLESGLEEVSEALANKGGDTEASTELNNYVRKINDQLEKSVQEQKELFLIQDEISISLEFFKKEIELLRDTKADRDEVEDAFRDKAGIDHINNLVSVEQHNGFVSHFDKRLTAAYQKFNFQELVWQEAIDDLHKLIDEKADHSSLESLRDDFNKKLQILMDRIQHVSHIVGEPKSAAISRRIHRDAACLACSTPAHMALEECTLPELPALKHSIGPVPTEHKCGNEGDNNRKLSTKTDNLQAIPKEYGDHRIVCSRAISVPHPNGLSEKCCNRYCGGSHTKISNAKKIQTTVVVNPLVRETMIGSGTDGKMYNMDDIKEMKPCIPCNIHSDKEQKESPTPLKPQDKIKKKKNSEVSSIFFDRDARGSSFRTSSVYGSIYYTSSIHEQISQPSDCSNDAKDESMKGVKNEEFSPPNENTPSSILNRSTATISESINNYSDVEAKPIYPPNENTTSSILKRSTDTISESNDNSDAKETSENLSV